jgi:hypothetical protein
LEGDVKSGSVRLALVRVFPQTTVNHLHELDRYFSRQNVDPGLACRNSSRDS